MSGIDWSKEEKRLISEGDKKIAGKDEFCRCAETVLLSETGVPYRVPKPKYHNCEYIRRVSDFVNKAVIIAGYAEAEKKDNAKWLRALSGAMNFHTREVIAQMDAEDAAKAAIALAAMEEVTEDASGQS